MPKEVERKFLVDGDFLPDVVSSTMFVQGYICADPGHTVRVRIAGDRAFLTIKGPGECGGVSRYEWEKEISVGEAEELLALCGPVVIRKVRHLVPSSDGVHTWEVDVFEGDNEGLVVAEIELGCVDEAFPRPSWLGKEVSGDRRYYNSELLKRPFRTWK